MALKDLPLISHPNLIMGIERSEDAGVYKLTEKLAIIQTLDFFTPIVDNPYDFGQIAATNSLSDVYAKGGKPVTAMNIVCFPIKKMDINILREIMRGGLDKMREAGVVLVGGHSVDDNELKYGLSVTGVIHPKKVVMNNGAKPGDQLVITKKLGTGIISTGIKAGKVNKSTIKKITKSMTTLNKTASEVMMSVGVRACTDVTGFGFLGHAAEMLTDTYNGMVIESSKVPFFSEAKIMVEKGFLPGGLSRNRDYRKGMVEFSEDVPQYLRDILFDPQTSGGLLIAVAKIKALRLVDALHEARVTNATIVGEIVEKPVGKIIVR
jgi:selenide,water dikinase